MSRLLRKFYENLSKNAFLLVNDRIKIVFCRFNCVFEAIEVLRVLLLHLLLPLLSLNCFVIS